jgi:[ribosomal protein S18]-alanine N-acetyltransferase
LNGPSHNASDFVVRSGKEADLDAVYGLECAAFVGDRLSRRALRRFLRASHRPLLTARSGGRVIGYILVSLPPRSSAARIYSLAVNGDHGRRGVGRELLLAAERYARAHGRSRLRLEVRYDNAAAIALYEKLGYRCFGRHPGYYDDGAEALRFEKALVPAQK